MLWMITHWRLIGLSVLCVGLFSLGLYLRGAWQDIADAKRDREFQEWFNKNAVQLEEKRAVTRKNERKVMNAQKNLTGDCLVTADRLPILNAALTNDTSKLGK